MPEWVLNKEKQYSIVDYVAESLRTAIISGEVGPGEKLNEQEVAEKLEVSRTPVREAFRTLETEGYLKHKPRCGVTVMELSLEEIEEIWQVRVYLDLLVAEETCKRIDDKKRKIIEKEISSIKNIKNPSAEEFVKFDERFREFFVSNCGNTYLMKLTEDLRKNTSLIRRMSEEDPERIRGAVQECIEIYQALAENDVEKTKSAVRKHFEKSLENIIKSLKQQKAIKSRKAAPA